MTSDRGPSSPPNKTLTINCILTSCVAGPAGQPVRGQRVWLASTTSPPVSFSRPCSLWRFLLKPFPSPPRIARAAGQQILSSRGVIRGITNWGPFLLPKPTTKHQSLHHTGHYFVMRFDASAAIQQSVRRSLGLDPRMIRFSVVKVGDRLGGKEARSRQGAMEHVPGQTYSEWNTQRAYSTQRAFLSSQSQRGAKGPFELP